MSCSCLETATKNSIQLKCCFFKDNMNKSSS